MVLDSEYLGEVLRDLSAAGKYSVDGELGRGGMSCVIRAKERAKNRSVAIKVMTSLLRGDPICRERFLGEVRMMSDVVHPSVVRVFDSGCAAGSPYLVTELVEGRSLKRLLDNERLTAPRILKLARQILAGLTAIHAHDIVHRDLKPENILVPDNPAESIKIADFGIAKKSGAADAVNTAEGTLLGTP